MSNLAGAENLESLQSIANPLALSAASGRTSCIATGTLAGGSEGVQVIAFPKRHKKDTRMFIMNDWRVCDKYYPAVLMLGQLRYWLTNINPATGKSRATDGHDWEKELGIGRKQVERASEIPTTKHLIATEYRQHGFFKSARTEYSLTPEAIAIGAIGHPVIEKSQTRTEAREAGKL